MAASKPPSRSAAGKVRIHETSDYPWCGDIRIAIEPEAPVAFDLKLRVPAWAKGAAVAVNSEPVALAMARGYATIHRTWSRGDVVSLKLPMPAERLYAHPKRQRRRRARGVAARPADLLRRGDRQSRRPRSDAGAATLGGGRAALATGPVRRRHDAGRGGEAPRPGRRATRFIRPRRPRPRMPS